MIIELGGKFPWVHEHHCEVVPPWKEHKSNTWYVLPDNRLGVIHHTKPDGKVAVRPITPEGKYYPNPSAHWPMEERMKIPEEIVLDKRELKVSWFERLPKPLQAIKKRPKDE